MGHSVGRVAGLAGVTVRTLHHYDALGLLVPSERTGAGHRRYSERDLDRLQQILFYRSLGFPLEEVGALLDDPTTDPLAQLRRRHTLLRDRIEALEAMAAAVEKAMEAQKLGINLTPEEKFEVFGDFDPDAYTEEVERRWGGCADGAVRESRRRTAGYTKADWTQLRDEMAEIHQRIADRLAAGTPADAPETTELAEEHRRFISRTSYACDHAMHSRLGEMYVADPRFTATYEAIRPGLAAYLRDAIHANERRHQAG